MLVVHVGIGHAADHAAGIVDEAVEPAEMLRAFLDHAVDVGGDARIALDEQGLAAAVADGLGQLFGGIPARIVVQRDAPFLRGIGQRKAAPMPVEAPVTSTALPARSGMASRNDWGGRVAWHVFRRICCLSFWPLPPLCSSPSDQGLR